jgi:hypothetical protein
MPLAHICNLSLGQGIFPNQMKSAKIVPVHKSGDTQNCDNYRPIALLNSFSKILEKVAVCRLVDHLEYHGIIDKYQFGFQRSRNTKQNLLQVVNFISNEINNGNFCVGGSVILFIRSVFIQSIFIQVNFYTVKIYTVGFYTVKIYTVQNLYGSKFIRIKIYTGQNLYGQFLYRSNFIQAPKHPLLLSCMYFSENIFLLRGKTSLTN